MDRRRDKKREGHSREGEEGSGEEEENERKSSEVRRRVKRMSKDKRWGRGEQKSTVS